MIFDTTICAPATSGKGAIALIRISGPDSFVICERIISFPDKKKKLRDQAANTIHFGNIMDQEQVLDEVLISLFRAPYSYTGDDSVEISCHASPYVQKRLLELLVEKGAFLAKPGEFTQRAFLNGKMDLSQAEAVADLIASETRAAHRIAMDQMRGGFSDEIRALRQELLHFASMIELELDFSEEDVEFADREQLRSLVEKILSITQNLLLSFSRGNVIKNGVPVAIIGKPNVGKSTLLNRLLNEERAIVSEIAGTTRDAIEDTITLHGITYRFIDTAGLRETADFIENLGIRKTYQKIEHAAIVLLLADAGDDTGTIMAELGEIRKQVEGKDKPVILVLNKSDLHPGTHYTSKKLKLSRNEYLIHISAETGQNIDSLIQLLIEASRLGDLDNPGVIVSNIRHYEALKYVTGNLYRVLTGLKEKIPEDLLAQDIREALHYLGEITGDITNDEILGNIFKNFCIGK
jgi:tRNA modification GTPase